MKNREEYVLPTHRENENYSKFEREIYGNETMPVPNKGYT